MGTTGEPLQALAAMGVRIAIDDFGTGYSNLAYLRALPVHGLKLAGPFVNGSGKQAGDRKAGTDGGTGSRIGGRIERGIDDGTDEVDLEVLALLSSSPTR